MQKFRTATYEVHNPKIKKSVRAEGKEDFQNEKTHPGIFAGRGDGV